MGVEGVSVGAVKRLMTWTISDYLQFGLLLTTVFAVLAALFGEKFEEWAWGPNINLKFDKESDRCFRRDITVPEDRIQKEQFSPFLNVKRVYYRLRIENDGGLAKNVKAKIDIFDSEEKEIPYFEPSTLNWISGKEREDLARKEVNYVNICSQVITPDVEFRRKINIDGAYVENPISRRLRAELFDTSPRGIIWDFPLDDYIFKITVYGANFDPLTKKFEFKKPSSNTRPGDLVEISWSVSD